MLACQARCFLARSAYDPWTIRQTLGSAGIERSEDELRAVVESMHWTCERLHERQWERPSFWASAR